MLEKELSKLADAQRQPVGRRDSTKASPPARPGRKVREVQRQDSPDYGRADSGRAERREKYYQFKRQDSYDSSKLKDLMRKSAERAHSPSNHQPAKYQPRRRQAEKYTGRRRPEDSGNRKRSIEPTGRRESV